ncbi:hypothetical protein UCRPA7_5868 [Phaeoacremonium minimum UCRPA7]|uniref:Uncharacterized protein n=1 Tax=Phaeoacremonium minimum (strain UCR-PA7) TaxID=1286976 RepID=R8BH27_PHAM7|nr:hypothetical protein UCRPA7_5868 [Phaeoacremonium minimum UCRPA7]EON98613.1 hypothetical protein UCRPA7_5868 [Phaeoacremonium minimum UCRPA7]
MLYGHSRTRTTSSNVFPAQIQSPTPMHLVQPQQQSAHNRRSPSVNTFSTVSSSGMAPPAAYRTSPTTDLRRSTSSRSAGSTQPSSYVALLRKQKATVWCDRAQYEDPRLLAAQRAAKMRANLEVVGSGATGLSVGGLGGRTSTGLSSAGGKVAAKIRHHGKPGVVGYTPDSNYVGVGGVPLRLSATEVEGEDSEEDEAITQRLHHRRTGSSGRSSTAGSIGRRGLNYRSSGGLVQTGSRRWSPGDTPERTGSLVEETGELRLQDDSASGRAQSTGSGSSAERADNVPDMGAARLASNSLAHATVTREKSVKNVDDLRRRGSVDERTMTLTTGRLFIANPD